MADPADLPQRRAVEEEIAKALNIVRRAQWGARPPARPLEFDWAYDSIVVHYSGHNIYTDPKQIQDFDMGHDRSWDDFAYHYVVAPTGRIYEGREIIYKGSHVKLQNTRKIGIVCMGDYDSSIINWYYGRSYDGDPVSSPMLDALRRLSRELMRRFPISVFGGHKEYGETDTCPGTNLLPKVVEMRAELKLAAPTFKKL